MFCIEPISGKTRPFVDAQVAQSWGGPLTVSRGTLHDTRTHLGYVAVADGEVVGYALYRAEADACELTVLESLREAQGIGGALIGAVLEAARAAGCGRVWLITTNDNTHAIRFYQRFGFSLRAVHIGTMQEARKLKPQIPLLGEDDIEIAHEFEFEFSLAEREPAPVRFTIGDVSEALSIMQEAAQWCVDTGRPMWELDELVPERFKSADGEFVVMWQGEESVAAAILSFEDQFFWPDVPAGTSGFIHKLAVRRKYAGKGTATALIHHMAQRCKDKGIPALRLDCDPRRMGLCRLYEACGFKRVALRCFNTQRYGDLCVAYYEWIFKGL